MRRPLSPLLTVFLPVLFVAATFAVTVAAGQDATPAQQYQAHMKAYRVAAGAFRKAENDLQRKRAVEQLDTFPDRFLDLAAANPDDPIALQALRQATQAVISVDSAALHAWEISRGDFPVGSRNDSANRIVALLLRDHITSSELAPICDRMRFGVRQEFHKFLDAALDENSNRNVLGMASLAKAQLLHTYLRMVELARDRPGLIARYDTILGKGYLQALEEPQRAALAAQIESLYEAAAEFDDVTNIPFPTTVADRATQELNELRHLSIGKLAPDLKGLDQDAKEFQLSDYRGKVVLLYFWLEF
ncbi:MAG: redoxin domain-containing protein [Pirellulaceae bacterium]|jgi:hypothetical protein|nr:redoxin domain-containing protein [Pirellulaceae bacterium]MDP7017332.1 redoxin domain-containing protein [Pirellulaceae bacterium]